MIAEAERLFDPATPVLMPPGTRYGKSVHGIADRLGRTPDWVDKIRQLRKIDPESRVRAEEQADGSLRMLLDLAAEPEVVRRIRALTTRANQGGRKTAMRKLLVAAAHPLAEVAPLFTDPANVLANVPDIMLVPAEMCAHFRSWLHTEPSATCAPRSGSPQHRWHQVPALALV